MARVHRSLFSLHLSVLLAAILLAPFVASPAYAEAGDYSAFRTALNLIFPPGADNPVTPAQMQGPYPLLPNPAAYADGFSPGAYYQWQTIRLAPSTGAVCGNGSQYKFFVNRVPNTRNNYAHLRRDLAPTRGFLIDDSGPAFSAPAGADPSQYPSRLLHTQIRTAWGLDQGPLPYLATQLPAFTSSDLGTLYGALSSKYSGDRLGHTHFWQDMNYSSYSYERFHADIIAAPTQAAKEALIHAKWAVDTSRLNQTLQALPNLGGYFPQFRALNESHCTTIVDFENGDVQERGLELRHFVDSVLDGSGNVLDASEASDAADRAKPFNPLYFLIDSLLN